MFRSKELQRSLMPLIIVNSIVCTGLFEYFVDRTIRTIGFAYVVCSFIFYNISVFVFKNMLGNFTGNQGTELRKIIMNFNYFSNMFIYAITIFNGFMRRKRLRLFVERIEICTRGIADLNISENYSSLFRYLCVIGVFLIFISSNLFLCAFFWFSEKLLWSNLNYSSILMLFYAYLSPVVVMLITDFTFVFWIKYIKIKFGQLNAALQSMMTTTIDSPQHKKVLRMKDNWEDDLSLSTVFGTYKTNENLAKLKQVKQIYLELMECARIINDAFGLQNLISLLICILFITSVSYNLYVFLMTTECKDWIKQLYMHFCWIFSLCIMLFAKMNICETTITEKTGEILYELYEPSTSRKFRDQIRDFIFQLIQNRLKFTACGFCDIDHTLIYSVIGSITTYLVILIQAGGEPKVFSDNTPYNSTSTI